MYYHVYVYRFHGFDGVVYNSITNSMKMLWGASLKQTKTELNGGDVMIYQKENLYHNISRQVI